MNETWLKMLSRPVPPEIKNPQDLALSELRLALPNEAFTLNPVPEMGESYQIRRQENQWILTGGRTGLLYGAYALIRRHFSGHPASDFLESAPRYPLRMINCWDNADGSVERGYSGQSLFFDGNRLSYDSARMRQLGRMLASVGINVLCINNVNVHEPAQELLGSWLPELSQLAGLFRPFGVRLMLSIDFSQPMRRDLNTANPLGPEVQAWWRDTVDRVYYAIPDLAGFLV